MKKLENDTLHLIRSPERGFPIEFHLICGFLIFDPKCPFTSKMGHKWVTKIQKET